MRSSFDFYTEASTESTHSVVGNVLLCLFCGKWLRYKRIMLCVDWTFVSWAQIYDGYAVFVNLTTCSPPGLRQISLQGPTTRTPRKPPTLRVLFVLFIALPAHVFHVSAICTFTGSQSLNYYHVHIIC